MIAAFPDSCVSVLRVSTHVRPVTWPVSEGACRPADSPRNDRSETPSGATGRNRQRAVWRSLQLRMIGITLVVVAGMLALLAAYMMSELKKGGEESLLHEALLFSDTLESSIIEMAAKSDIAGIQAQIDRMVAIRKKNDLEINVLMFEGREQEASLIVASNDPLNIEPTSPEEHQALLASTQQACAVTLIDHEDGHVDADDDLTKRSDPSHPDYYFRPGVRYMSITTPLIASGRPVGSLNTKLSLQFLDDRLAAIRKHIAVAFAAGFVVLSAVVFLVLSRHLFKPLKMITESIFEFGLGRFTGDMALVRRRDEIGELALEFSRMVNRIGTTEASLAAAARSLEEKNHVLEALSSKLAKYLSPQVYRSIFAGKRQVELATDRKKLTVFFSDIVDFTATTEQMEPEDLTELLNQYFVEMSAIALKFGATIDKFVGDAILLFFGDPESRGVDVDARACVRMACEMQRKMAALEDQWRRQGYPKPFQIRIGINTGYCNVGNFGSEQRMDYTIIGREVNLAARLQSIAEPGGIRVSFETWALVQNLVEAEELPPIRLKGFDRPIRNYAVRGIYAEEQACEPVAQCA